MDDEAALLALRVARAATAWLRAPVDVEAYRRLVAAVERWERYDAPALGEDELLDELAADNPPQPLGEVVPELEAALRRKARQEL